jgi:hypothetical protein
MVKVREGLELALVDDSRAFYLAWKLALRDQAFVHFFDSPEAFLAATDRDDRLLERLALVILDQRFRNSMETGRTLAVKLRRRAPRLRLVLSSGGQLEPGGGEEPFDLVIDKGPLPLESLLRVH